jgi:hypothetical protein
MSPIHPESETTRRSPPTAVMIGEVTKPQSRKVTANARAAGQKVGRGSSSG